MYREFENGMLARFRAMQSKLAETEPEARLYALVDMGHMSDRERAFLCDGWNSQHRSLYAGSGLDHLEQTGPILFAMPDLQGDQTYTVSFMSGQANPLMIFWRVLHLAEMDAQLVSWVWTSCDIEPFVEHLQTLLHARLGPDDEKAWFFFYQPSYLRVLYHSLPADTRRHVYGPCHAWWTLDIEKRLVELAGENLPTPVAWDVFPIPAETVDELKREVVPRQVLEWINKVMPDLVKAPRPNDRALEIAPFVYRALECGLDRKSDASVFVLYALRYGNGYDLHAEVQQAITRTIQGECSLIDAFSEIPADVWKSVSECAPLLLKEKQNRDWLAGIRLAGCITTSVYVINDSRRPVRNVQIEWPGKPDIDAHRIGNVGDGSTVSSVTKESVTVPLPGDRIVVRWSDSLNIANRVELTVVGSLPADSESGYMELLFYTRDQVAQMRADKIRG